VLSAAKGAPSDWIPLSPATVTLGQIALVKGSPHPSAAELWLEFMISKEGQQIFQKAGYFPTHPDVPAPWPELTPGPGRFEANILSPEIIARDLEKWNDIFKTLFR
jgi:iron(III) transport system substrate-binding protein